MNVQMPAAVYLLCLITSVVCAALLTRSYRNTRSRLLVWTAACFGFLALNNGLLVLDKLVFPLSIDLRLPRQLSSLAAVSVLLYGFIWESE